MTPWWASFSRRAGHSAVERAAQHIAQRVGADGYDVLLTSGATEANATAIQGTLRAAGGGHVVTVATEHVSVLRAIQRSADAMTVVPVDGDGRVDPDDVWRAIRANTVLVSVMAVNNEIGVVQDLPEIARGCTELEVPLHTDAAQLAYARLDASVGIDLVSVSGHKIGGPQGIGALLIRPGHPLSPLLVGGAQQGGLRAGTVPVALAVGLGAAAQIVEDASEIARLRDLLADLLCDRFDGARWIGSREHRAPHNLSLVLPGIDTALVVDEAADQVQVSTGSACSAGHPGPSHVIRALGIQGRDLYSVLRIGLGPHLTEDDVRTAADVLVATASHQQAVTA